MRRFMLLALLLGAGWLLFIAVRVEAVGRRDDAAQSDAIVVLGTAQYQGTPSPVFQSRLDHAADLYRRGLAPLIVVAGGKQEGDLYTEAAAGTRYLEANGVPREALLAVAEGNDTLTSLRGVARELRERQLRSVVLVSDRRHIFRSRAMTSGLRLQPRSSPTNNSPAEGTAILRVRYTAREVAAYTKYLLTRSYVPPGSSGAG